MNTNDTTKLLDTLIQWLWLPEHLERVLGKIRRPVLVLPSDVPHLPFRVDGPDWTSLIGQIWLREYAAFVKWKLAEMGLRCETWKTGIGLSLYFEQRLPRRYQSTNSYRFEPDEPTSEALAILQAAVEVKGVVE